MEAIPSCLNELATKLISLTGTLPQHMNLTAYVTNCIRADGSRIGAHDLVQALAQSLYITLAPSESSHSFLLHDTCSPTAEQLEWRTLGVSSLVVPFGAIKRSITARLGADLLRQTLLAPEQATAHNEEAAQRTKAVDALSENSLFDMAFDDIPVKSDYANGQPSISIDPSYSSELHRNIRSIGAMQWADRIADFDAAIGRIYLPEWIGRLASNVSGFIERARENLCQSLLMLLQEEVVPLHAARAVLNRVRDTLGQYRLPQLTTSNVEHERERWHQELNLAIEECPNQYAIAARLLLASGVFGYAFWHLLVRLRLPEQSSLAMAAAAVAVAAVVHFWLTLGRASTRLVWARESYLKAVSAAHAKLLLTRLKTLAQQAQSDLNALVEGIANDLNALEEAARSAHQHLSEDGASLSITKSPVECSIVDDSDLVHIYNYQEFDLHRLAEELVRWPLLDQSWRDLDEEALRRRVEEFAACHVARLNMMDFWVFAQRRFQDDADRLVTQYLERLAYQSVTLAPQALISSANSTDYVEVVSPPDEPIARVVQEVGPRIGVHTVYREDKYCITVFRTRSLSLPPAE